jgi:hypothetical protein
VGAGRGDTEAEETAGCRPPATREAEDDPHLVAFLTLATVIFAALWFGLSLVAGAL